MTNKQCFQHSWANINWYCSFILYNAIIRHYYIIRDIIRKFATYTFIYNNIMCLSITYTTSQKVTLGFWYWRNIIYKHCIKCILLTIYNAWNNSNIINTLCCPCFHRSLYIYVLIHCFILLFYFNKSKIK